MAACSSIAKDVDALIAGAEVDLRKARRYAMSATVSFYWDRGDGILQEGQGATRDVSSRGVFVVTDAAPRVGGQLELELYFKSPGRESKLVRFRGEGKVIRAVKKGGESGFAAEVLFQAVSPDGPFSDHGAMIQ
jgi:hypothetical protein